LCTAGASDLEGFGSKINDLEVFGCNVNDLDA
jgi:hypothetical protein